MTEATPATPRPTPQEYAEQLRAFNAEVKRKVNAHDALLAALRAALHDECSGFRDNTPCVGANWHEQARALLRDLRPEEEGQ